jgi:pimeloyl-ACP methyl ester carboxylesterase
MDKYIKTNGIQLHYLDFEGEKPTIVLLHGLSANAHAFDGLITAGLSPAHRVLSVDLRGRGLSDHPKQGYSMLEHAEDISGLLDALGLDQVILGGHSFGALVTIFMANHFPDRIRKVILMDAAARLHDNVREMVAPSMARLLETFPSFESYIEKIKAAPYLHGEWYPEMDAYYRADVEDLEGGGVRPRSKLSNIQQAIEGALAGGVEWLELIKKVPQPALLLQANEAYHLGAPILPRAYALETVDMLPKGQFVQVGGNHLTMLFGDGAKDIVKAIFEFVKNTQ